MQERVGGLRRSLIRRFRDLKLSSKMILIYAVILSGCLLFSIGLLQVSLHIFDEQLYEKSLQELDFFSQQINDRLTDVENLSYNIALDADIQEQLRKMQELRQHPSEYSYESFRFRTMLNNALVTNEGIENILYTDGKTTRIMVGTNVGELGADELAEVLEILHGAGGAYVELPQAEGYPYLLSGRDIRSYLGSVSLEYLGSLIFTTDVADVIKENVDKLAVESASLCVYSDSGLIYEDQDGMYDALPRFTGTQGFEIVGRGRERYFLCYLKSPQNGWAYVNMFPYAEIFRESQLLRVAGILGFGVIFFLAVILMRKTARMMTRPLEELSTSMGVAERGQLSQAREEIQAGLQAEPRGDEVGQLSQAFTQMLDQIESLIHENYEKQLLLRDTKLKMLQAQINPHFLYNTLNVIHWMIRSGKTEDGARMITLLGDLLRAAFSKHQYVRLSEELVLVKNYIALQEYRYRARASFIVETDGDLEACEVPHMFIQPLVENAITHGVDNSLKPCRVAVAVRVASETVSIEVRDSGPGMQPEELAAVRSFTVKPKGNGIGLKNIYERLRLSYDEVDFQVDSAPGEGTCVKIRIPARISEKQ